MTVSAPLARALAASRAGLNARVEQARKRHPGFDPAHYAAFLRDALDPLVAAIDAHDSARTLPAANALCGVALDLVAQGLAGPAARDTTLDHAWATLAPRLAPLVAREPVATIGLLSNALLNLRATPGARGDEWSATMAILAPRVDTLARLRALGALCAWRAGMAQYRASALDAADALPPALALFACGAADGDAWPAVRDALRREPWWNPRSRALQTEGREVGAFSGFGGAFAQPPQLRVGAAGFVVRSGERHFLLLADARGAVLLGASAEEFDAASPRSASPLELRGSVLHTGGRRIELPLPAEGLVALADAHTIAVASPWTHAIRLLPLHA